VALNSECDIRVKPRSRLARRRARAIAQNKKETELAATLLPALEKTLERRLKAEQTGEVRFDAFTRGRYATDASHYQIMPLGVVVPRSAADAAGALAVCRSEGVPVTPRGGGTSQAGQTVNRSVILDCSRHLNRIIEIDAADRRCLVEPGIVLDELNRALKPHGLWFPVDISTASRATVGGMVGNNSCGARSLRYGNTRENVLSIDAVLADGTRAHFGRMGEAGVDVPPALVRDLLAIAAREADEVERQFPKVQRRVGGYNLDALVPGRNDVNLAHLLVGSEGTLAFSTRIELKLSPLLGPRAVGACHFGSFHEAMAAAQHIVALKPIAVELIDCTMLGLAREIAMYGPTVDAFLHGDAEAILFVEFAEDRDENARRLKALAALIGDFGLSWDKTGDKWGGVVDVLDPKLQAAIGEVRTAGLNIMMSMKEEGKPISFVEDCAVPLEHLADYTARLTEIFEKNGTRGTWYAHAAVGCLHVRPVLNLRLEKDVRAMRAIAEEAFAMVRAYKGSHSGEHGDGIVRSEFHETMFGEKLVHAFEEVKDRFDPHYLFNPGKIVRAPKFDDRENFRYGPGYRAGALETALDWSAYPGAGGGFQGAVEMCNNNGACRALAGGVMCPSYRVTLDERDVTRGRANTLRLAITGQLGPDALLSNEMAETLKLCVSCKACRRECPTGVDMARMKIEVLRAWAQKFGLSLHDRLVGYLPRYAPYAARWSWLFNLRDRLPGAAALSEAIAQFAAQRPLPKWQKNYFRDDEQFVASVGKPPRGEVVLFADTFNRYFEPENVRAAIAVLAAGGYQVHIARPNDRGRPLCCGRTFLAVGKTDAARGEAERTLAALKPQLARGLPVIGLEPSCVFSFRDEIPALLKNDTARAAGGRVVLLEEFLAAQAAARRLDISFAPAKRRALLHGHCHQKSFGAMGSVETVLKLIPGLEVATIESSCCGMAGAFGYDAETIDVSRAMGELSLLPAVRQAPDDAIIVADGTSCRQQIRDGTRREAMHVARVLAMALP
jgi:FAD/FMN-containing dehydrogenase/Fe-S oxidoreductase